MDKDEYVPRVNSISSTFLMLDLEQHVEQKLNHRLNSDAKFANNVDKMVDDKLDSHKALLYDYFQLEVQMYSSDI